MAKVNFKVEMAEINTYDVQVEVSDYLSVEEQNIVANHKVINFIKHNNGLIVGGKPSDRVICCDREAATATLYCSKIIPS